MRLGLALVLLSVLVGAFVQPCTFTYFNGTTNCAYNLTSISDVTYSALSTNAVTEVSNYTVGICRSFLPRPPPSVFQGTSTNMSVSQYIPMPRFGTQTEYVLGKLPPLFLPLLTNTLPTNGLFPSVSLS